MVVRTSRASRRHQEACAGGVVIDGTATAGVKKGNGNEIPFPAFAEGWRVQLRSSSPQ